MDELTAFWRMRKTVLEMLTDRGYVVRDDITIPKDKFKDHFEGPKDLNKSFQKPDGSTIITVFDTPVHVDKNYLANIEKQMEDAHASRAIMIVPGEKTISSIAQRYIDKQRSEGKNIEIFLQKEVLMNITHHELVPRHEPLSEEEKQALLTKYKIKESQLPRILRTDPVSRYFGVEPGIVFKITRKSETAGEYITYRLVI